MQKEAISGDVLEVWLEEQRELSECMVEMVIHQFSGGQAQEAKGLDLHGRLASRDCGVLCGL